MIRTSLRAVALATVLSLAMGPLAQAQSNAPADEGLARREALVGQILEAQGGLAQMRQVMENAADGAGGALIKALPAGKEEEARAFLHQTMVEISGVMVPRIMEDSKRIWAAEFTEQELRDVLAFYQSPTGKTLVAKLPDISRQTGIIVARYAPEMQLLMLDRVCARFGCPAEVQSQIDAAKKQKARNAPL